MRGGVCVVVVLVVSVVADSDQDQLGPTRRSNIQESLPDVFPQPTKDTLPQARGFPYKFEEIAVAAQKNTEIEIGSPYTIMKKQLEAPEHHHLQDVSLLTPYSPARDDDTRQQLRPQAPVPRPPRPSLTTREMNFIGILAAIALKLALSTALATWFLAAGQVLYALATLTGSTGVFGMDSAIGYIYKTLPFIEVLLRGETTFF
ncbi:uncharacterized protein LOC121876630 isoform X2 [Homarus americanus]|uniref:uncharacterized protein LOC121876630 isoform X2 n=1 Tax=Homarus americanus TaxID=6706 RepID=UPI001C496285|nr:uncharacterized protein LOC121876630 isoform X2 [Homarus americanus]